MKRTAMLAPLLCALFGCATKGELNYVQQDMEDLKDRLVTVEKSITTVKQEALEISEKGSREALKNLETLRHGTADMQANLDAMRIDVQVMAGKIDDISLAAKKPFEDISLLKEDTAKAVKAMEERLAKLELNFQESRVKMDAIAKALETPVTPDSVYKQAQDAFKSGDTKKSREILTGFLQQYPNHKLSPNAQYWIGESYYLEKNYEQAVLEFQKVIKDFAGKDKVPAAMLKQAMAFRELGDNKSARFVLKELLDKYPNAEEAPMAKELLAKTK